MRMIFLTISLLFLVACSRNSDGPSRIQVKIPKGKNSSQKSLGKGVSAQNLFDSLPANRLQCFAVNVTGTGLPTVNRSCSPVEGVLSPFVKAGETITLDVDSGTNRRIEVFMFLAPEGFTTCPEWDDTFRALNGINFKSTFSVGAVADIDTQPGDNPVDIVVNFPGLTQHFHAASGVDAVCQVQVRSDLKSNGSLSIFGTTTSFTNSLFRNRSSFQEKGDFSQPIIHLTQGQNLFKDGVSTPHNIPKFIQSIAAFPGDPQSLVGLQHDGVLKRIRISDGLITDIQANCPFLSCKVPLWMQSISVAGDDQLYSLDQSGQVYKIGNGGTPDPIALTVPPYLQQISF